MKIIKAILYLIIILVVIIAAAAFFAPAEKTVERNITIDAPASVIFKQISNFENWKNWDAWYGFDSTQVRTMMGEQGAEGYGYSWTSDHKKVGNGVMTMTAQELNKSFSTHINMEDGQMEFDGGFRLEEADGKTKVSWTMESKLGFPMKAMHYFTEKWVGPDFEAGLANLKQYVESHDMEEEQAGMEVEIVSEFGVNYAIVRSAVSFATMDKFYEGAYPMIFEYLRTNGLEAKGPSSSLFYTWDEENRSSDMAAAVAISDPIDREETEKADLGVGEASVGPTSITYQQVGGYGQSYASHTAIGEWLKNNTKEMNAPVVEEYIKGPYDEVDSTAYITNIIYHFAAED